MQDNNGVKAMQGSIAATKSGLLEKIKLKQKRVHTKKHKTCFIQQTLFKRFSQWILTLDPYSLISSLILNGRGIPSFK